MLVLSGRFVWGEGRRLGGMVACRASPGALMYLSTDRCLVPVHSGELRAERRQLVAYRCRAPLPSLLAGVQVFDLGFEYLDVLRREAWGWLPSPLFQTLHLGFERLEVLRCEALGRLLSSAHHMRKQGAGRAGNLLESTAQRCQDLRARALVVAA